MIFGNGPNQSPGYRFIWRDPRRTRTLCLGSENEISEADAFRLAAHARKLLARGFNPIDVRQAALDHAKRHWDSMP
jgi:hypothetical protein